MKKLSAIFMSCIAAVTIILSGCGMNSFVNIEQTITEVPEPKDKSDNTFTLEADEYYLLKGESMPVTFTIDAGNVGDSVVLFDTEGNTVGMMNDDGTNGDSEANDGIYSYQVDITPSDLSTTSYVASDGNKTSNEISLYVFDLNAPMDADTAKTIYDEISTNIHDAAKQYKDDDGYVREEDIPKALDAAEECVKEAQAKGDVIHYSRDKKTLYYKLSSGIGVVYNPPVEGVASGGVDAEVYLYGCQPNYDIAESDLEWKLTNNVTRNTPNCFLGNVYEDSAVDLDFVAGFQPNSVVLWIGHGNYNNVIHSYIVTAEEYEMKLDLLYRWDGIRDAFVVENTDYQKNRVAFTSKFVEEKCGDLSNSMFIFASCHSAHDTVLWEAFENKGASTFIGFSEEVYAPYCKEFALYVLKTMASFNENTKDYYTAEDAFLRAKTYHGENDGIYAKNHPENGEPVEKPDAVPRLLGDENYQLSKVEPELIYSSNMAVYNGTTYCARYTENIADSRIQKLDIQPAKYDYICSFAFCDDRLYYSCKESGTSDYHSAIYSCNPDGSDLQLIADGDYGTTEFIICNNILMYNVGTNMNPKFVELDTMQELDVMDPVAALLLENVKDVTYNSEKKFYDSKGNVFYAEGSRIYSYPRTSRNSEKLWVTELNNLTIQTVTDDSIYYTSYSDNQGSLYRFDLVEFTTEKIGSHMAAGGGDVFFNW